MSARTPTGITAVCAVGGLQALVPVMLSVLPWLGGETAGADPVVPGLAGLQVVGLAGLWAMQSWGWWLTVGVYTLNTLGSLLAFVGGSPLAVVGLAIDAWILVYVAGEKPQYGRASTGPRPRSTA